MSINYAILGILSYRPLTGYDLKKIIQESPFMYWSGNNNQIYKALVELLKESYVTSETQHQDGSPSKKIYTITAEGLAELKDWVLSAPEPPEWKKTFLIQLAWADQLKSDELNNLITKYENEIEMQIFLQKERKRRGAFAPGRNAREIYLWDMIYENIISSYENELAWLAKIRTGIDLSQSEENGTMKYDVKEKNNRKYLECISAVSPLRSEGDALELIALCGEHDTNCLLLHGEVLAEDFFMLKTGTAGRILQKLVNYRVKTAVLLPEEYKISGKFKELAAESNKGKDFRVFRRHSEAEDWLVD